MAEPEKRVVTHGVRCFSKIKMFLLALTWAFVSKSLSGTYMNSMLTQIERQFDIPTSIVGFINGSFEIGNLLLIIFVSYFGTKLHRPIMIGIGCVVMGLGCFLISLPHFLMDRYEYETTISSSSNLSSNSFLCSGNRSQTLMPTHDPAECVKEIKSLMWIYVVVGNIIRGIGETPIMPLGISYIEDFAKSENSPLYIGILETGMIIGPLIGLMLGSFCAKLYVDTGSVNIDFLPFMKSLSCNPIYMLFILISVLQFNAFINSFTFMPKYLEQQYGKSTAEIVFLIGLYNLPPICVGYLIGGLIMKKFKITVKKAAYIAFCLSLTEYLLSFFNFMMACDNFPVAGLTTSYEGIQQPLYEDHKVLVDCNTRCSCLNKTWDPVCGDNGLSYMSACLAGCEKSVGTGINMVFQNCSCIQSSGNASAVLGLCNKSPDCTIKLQYFLIVSVFGCFIYSLSAIPGYMVLLRCIKSEEKSLGIGLHAFCTRIFAGIPAPIYFGALIDRTCLHWGTLKCGEPGACRMYDINNFRRIYLGLPAALRGSSFIPGIFILILMRKVQLPGEIDFAETEHPEMKLTEKKGEHKDVHGSPEVENNKELKTKL
ncbi:solute carrier organic anion transporter family member 1A5-like isoform X2 [Alexandromys fortis]|uniref:solute carrier organic anion transporter family member 1A5-like isoform X2 n=1 Tax=Alexandromys fortis TaxID=100897 RepID=UPI00215227F7|nr:solute carrier organic anion transporter family member 1A5-like isoform X2 [Microtus fortis]